MAIDLYQMLKIPRNARVDVIDQAIKTAWTYGHLPSKMLVTAQRILLNPAMRKEYDRRLAEAQKPVAPPAPATHELVFAASGAANAYQSPRARVDDVAVDGRQVDGKLFSLIGIGIATFFGTTIAGGLLLAHNYRRLGNRSAANWSLLLGFGWVVVLWAVCLIMPGLLVLLILSGLITPLVIGLWLLQLSAVIGVARVKQGASIQVHRDSGGRMASNWLALGIGLLAYLLSWATSFALGIVVTMVMALLH